VLSQSRVCGFRRSRRLNPCGEQRRPATLHAAPPRGMPPGRPAARHAAPPPGLPPRHPACRTHDNRLTGTQPPGEHREKGQGRARHLQPSQPLIAATSTAVSCFGGLLWALLAPNLLSDCQFVLCAGRCAAGGRPTKSLARILERASSTDSLFPRTSRGKKGPRKGSTPTTTILMPR
jgi:hypothetical protein